VIADCDPTAGPRDASASPSKGYRQRVGLAQALVSDPDVLVLDEPTSGLDPVEIVRIRARIAALANEKTILLSTHVLSEVEEVCRRVLILAGGRLVADGSLLDLAAGESECLSVVLGVEEARARSRGRPCGDRRSAERAPRPTRDRRTRALPDRGRGTLHRGRTSRTASRTSAAGVLRAPRTTCLRSSASSLRARVPPVDGTPEETP
jgi:ABC-type multidrug transport system ATPase subunit